MTNHNNDTATFPDRLREAMRRKNVRAVDLSEKTGVPKGAISYYLAGKSQPKADRLYQIARALDVSEAWLLGYDVPMERKESQKKNDQLAKLVAKMRKEPGFFRLVSAMSDMPLPVCENVLSVIEAINGKKPED